MPYLLWIGKTKLRWEFWVQEVHFCFADGGVKTSRTKQWELSFSQLGNSGNSVKGKSLTNAKMYVEKKGFSWNGTKCQ